MANRKGKRSKSKAKRTSRRSPKNTKPAVDVPKSTCLTAESDDPFHDADLGVASTPELSGAQVKYVLHSVFSGSLMDPDEFPIRTTIADERYLCVPVDFVRRFALMEPWLAPSAYKGEVFDCDDYVQFLRVRLSCYAVAKKLKWPLAVGYVLTYRHAFNLCLDPGGVVAILNTQSDQRAFAVDPDLFQEFMQVSQSNPILAIYI